MTVGPSPAWLAGRLTACGVRSINNIVDITNYVLLETGHPIHAYDLARLAQSELRARRAAPGEPVRTLDGVTRTASADMLVIADASRTQGFGGIMGGGDSEVTERHHDHRRRERALRARARCGARHAGSGWPPRRPTASSAAPTTTRRPRPSPAPWSWSR